MPCVISQSTWLKPHHTITTMTATRASKRSETKTHGLDGSPSTRTRSHTHRDRLCELLLTLDPSAITRAVKVLEAYDQERSSLDTQAQSDRLVAKRCGSHHIAQGTSRLSPAVSASVSSGGVNSSCTSYASTTINTRPFGWSTTSNTPTTFTMNREMNSMGSRSTFGELNVLFASIEDMQRFKENVLVVKGVVGSISELDGHKVDGIVIPTTSSLCNSSTGAAAATIRRTDNGLTFYVQGFSRFAAGAARVTGGFGAGADKPIHAVEPSASTPQCHQVIEATYTNVMEAAQRENLTCLAFASISTRNQGVSCEEGALVALRAIQRSLSRGAWSGVMGIVCNEQKLFDAFTQEKQAVLDAFNSRSL